MPPKNQKYCSQTCMGLAQRNPNEPCANPKCGKMFHPMKSTSRYCSLVCYQLCMSHRHSDEVCAKFIELWNQGISYREINRRIGLRANSVEHLRERLGLTPRHRHPRVSVPTAYYQRSIEQLPVPFRVAVPERLIAGAEPLPPMHPISWGAIAL